MFVMPCVIVALLSLYLRMPGCSSCALPFSALCDDIVAMLVCTTCWLYMHFYMFAYIFMHESCLLVCRPCFNTNEVMDIRSQPTFFPRGHHFLLVCLFTCLFAILLCFPFCSYPGFYVCHVYLSCLSALCLFIVLCASFPSMAYLMVSCLCLCMYTHEARTHGAKAWFPRNKQKGCRCMHVVKLSGYS